jgi:hypothetical protein
MEMEIIFNDTKYDRNDFVISCKDIQVLIPDKKIQQGVLEQGSW